MHFISDRRWFCAGAVVLSSMVGLGQQSFGETFVSGFGTNYGVTQLPIDTNLVTMPTSSGGSNLSVAWPRAASNLGTFNIQINAGPTLAANAAALAAFNRAAELWEARIADPITVVIQADLAPLGGAIGATHNQLLAATFNTVRTAMVADAADEGTSDLIVASLPTAANYTVTMPAGFGLNGNVFASKANLKALGFHGPTLDSIVGTTTDANITFNTDFAFDFDKSNGVTSGQYDFEGVAAHEIGHALGFISGVDDVDFVLPGTATNIEFTPLDMFRFRNGTNDPTTALDFSNVSLQFPRNMVPSHQAILDQILPEFGDLEVLMSQGRDFGDGQQASHWKDNLGLGLLDPTAGTGQILALTENDFRSMDLIGYEINAVPEPGTVGALAVAGLLTLARRRRRAC